jgi:hypothetical protein
MRTYKLMVADISTYSFDGRVHYLRSLTTPELNLLKEGLTRENYFGISKLLKLMVDAIFLERLPEIREDKLNQILNDSDIQK